MFKYGGIILGIFALFGTFFVANKAKAADEDIIINEVMADPSPCDDKDCEWIELFNKGDYSVNLHGWSLGDKEIKSDVFVQPQDYLIVTKNIIEFTKYYSVDPLKIFEFNFGTLNNTTKDSITLQNDYDTPTYIEGFNWDKSPGTNISWEKIDPKISADTNWHASLINGGTPGKKNSVTDLIPPQSPIGLSPAQSEEIEGKTSIEFTWQENDTQKITFEFILSTTEMIADIVDLVDLKYQVDDLEWGIYYWQIIASNGLQETKSPIYTFSLVEPKYCDAIIINEILPDPVGDETAGEWIELYNNSTELVNLKGWWLEDIKGTIHKYIINDNLILQPQGYGIIYRSKSGITLNNDQDGLRLYQPDGRLLYETPIFSNGEEGWAWARGPTGVWQWTVRPTLGQANIIEAPKEEAIGGSSDELTSVINNTPVEISTGDYKNYENQLVKVRGEVVDTSGDTFWLDDGSGSAKIYIQEKTGIDKPEMHTGDIFEVIGLVDLYGADNWRILPRNQNDINLIEQVSKKVVSSSATTAAKKSSTTSTSSPKSIGTGISTVKATAGAETSDKDFEQVRSPFWVQLIKTLLGLAVILLIVIIIRLRQRPKEKIIGGHFGDET